MIVLFMLFIILNLSFGIKIRFKISEEKSIFVALFGLTIFLYVLGLVNLLKISKFIIITLSVISLIYTLVKLIKKQVKIRELVTMPTIIYCLLIGFAYYIVREIKYIYYDEFMFWGTNLKLMYENSCLWANFSIEGIHLVYPPFTAITEYIFLQFNGEFNEAVTYLGIITLMVTSLMLLFENEKYNIKAIFKVILTVIATYVAIVLCNHSVASLLVDWILGVFFAIAMFLGYKAENKKDYIILSILLISITLTKLNGILFSGIVIMQIFFKKVFFIIKNKEINKQAIIKTVCLIVILLFTIIFTYATWKIYYTINGKQIDSRHDQNYVENINFKEFINAITQNENSSDRNRKVASDFYNKLLNSKIIRKYKYNTSIYTITIINFAYVMYIIITKNKLKKVANLISFNIGFVIYILTNLFIFMMIFQYQQGESLMGFERYISTYILAMLLNLIYSILEETNWKKLLLIFLTIIIMQKGFNGIMADPRIIYNIFKGSDINRIIKNSEQIKQTVDETQKVYLIDQKLDIGQEFVKTRYYISPIQTNLLYEWNIGTKQSNIYYKMNISQQDFIEKLINENYDYLYIISFNKEFLEDYSGILTDEVKNKLQEIVLENEKRENFIINQGMLLKINKETKKIENIY